MKINPNIFKAYDIRGIYPNELNEETAFLIGKAFIRYLKKIGKVESHFRIIVSRDDRPSSMPLMENLIKGLAQENVKIINAGQTSTPMHYWIINKELADGGIMITASHIPKEFNGFKISRETAIPLGVDSGLNDIKDIIESENFTPTSKEPKILGDKKMNEVWGFTIYDQNYLKKYVRFLTGGLDLKSMKIAIDNGNGMAGAILPSLFKELPTLKIIPLYFEPDGTFPNHEANPLKEETLNKLKETIKNEKADMGIAFDGDGDRIFFLNKEAKRISADLITALIAEDYLKKHPGASILYDPRSSKIVKEAIEFLGGTAIMSKVGHAFFKKAMRENDAIFGGELSGHYYFKDFFSADSGIFAMLKVLSIISESRKNIDELIKPFQKYFHSGEINFNVKNQKKVIEKIKGKYKDAKKIFDFDGTTIEYDDWWFNLRPSNTENLLRLNLEAKTENLMKEKVKKISDLINL